MEFDHFDWLSQSQVRYGKSPVLKIEQNFETLQNDSRLLYWHKIWHGNSHCQFKSKKVTIFWESHVTINSGGKTIQIWPPNFGSKRQSEGYLQNLQKMALTAWDRVYFSNPTGSFENRYLLFLRGVIYHLLFTVVKINDPPGE